MIAAALAVAPRLLLADEPTTALDVTTQSDVMAILDTQRRERGLAMVFVTHDLELAAAVCDRIAVLYAGSSSRRFRPPPATSGDTPTPPGSSPRARTPLDPGSPLRDPRPAALGFRDRAGLPLRRALRLRGRALPRRATTASRVRRRTGGLPPRRGAGDHLLARERVHG